MNSKSRHQEALIQLEQGHPTAALQLWRELLLSDQAAVERHLQAALAGLGSDAIAPLRRQALTLAQQLLAGPPQTSEVEQLGQLLRGWGELCLAEAPGRALQHLERAWACGNRSELQPLLAQLYTQQGMADGATALIDAASSAGSSKECVIGCPPAPCLGLSCNPCQEQLLQGAPNTAAAPPVLQVIRQGQIWIQNRTNPWQQSHGVAVADSDGAPLPELCRRYPWPWPHCPHQRQHQQAAAQQLAAIAQTLGQPTPIAGRVLAVADLSAELYFHWLVETLPRLGWSWKQMGAQASELKVWHNGGNAPWVRESLGRLGIAPEQILTAQELPWIQAEELLVPSFASPFGVASPWAVAWLRLFWGLDEHPSNQPTCAALYLPRGPSVSRRPLLGEEQLLEKLKSRQIAVQNAGLPVAKQLRQIVRARNLIAPHGAALANLFAASHQTDLLEWVNPAYAPPYFHSLSRCTGVQHTRVNAQATPLPLQEWLYAGPLAFPIDPGANPTALLPPC